MSKQIYICSDNIERLRLYPDNSIDSIATDAPYGLGKEPDVIKMLTAWLSNGFMEVEGGGFMGKKWDSFVPQPNFWKEVIRVLKPGGHVLCFFGTRTYDWGVMAMRIAGFEIRDQIQWLYGSGFPKNMNISKAIDDHFGAEREVIGTATSGAMQNGSGENGRPYHEANKNENGKIEYQITAAATEEAKQWDGYGTALKPANEPIVLARKPIEKGLTIAENVLKWGTGAIDIDACRIETDEEITTHARNSNGEHFSQIKAHGTFQSEGQKIGRFPANVLMDDEAAMVLDQQTGTLTSGKPSGVRNTEGGYQGNYGGIPVTGYGDSGGASRFFYVAKASKSERNKGLEHLEKKQTVGGGGGIGNYINDVNSASGKFGSEKAVQQNTHPTVKPVSLMQYLVRMITPAGGVCLDPFNGSGTTGIACTLDNINYIGIDNTEEYIDISEARRKAWKNSMNNQISLF